MSVISPARIEGGVASAGSWSYTVPRSLSLLLSSIIVMNPDTVSHTFRIAVVPVGETKTNPDHYIYYDIPVPSKNSRILTGFQLGPETTIWFEDSTNLLVFTMFGELVQ